MGKIAYYTALAVEGTRESVGRIMCDLHQYTTIADTKFIDFALGSVKSEEGIRTMKHYLFHGTQMQRNYAALFFSRIEEYDLVVEAYHAGLIDEKQAFSR